LIAFAGNPFFLAMPIWALILLMAFFRATALALVFFTGAIRAFLNLGMMSPFAFGSLGFNL